jgi:hypothetical protein
MRTVAHPLFGKLAEKLAQMVRDVEEMRTAATYRRGAILPDLLPLDRESGDRPVQVMLPAITPGGIILPNGYRAA